MKKDEKIEKLLKKTLKVLRFITFWQRIYITAAIYIHIFFYNLQILFHKAMKFWEK